jgi:hypothetical protein
VFICVGMGVSVGIGVALLVGVYEGALAGGGVVGVNVEINLGVQVGGGSFKWLTTSMLYTSREHPMQAASRYKMNLPIPTFLPICFNWRPSRL